MKHSICEWLDTYIDESVNLTGNTPLSSAAIKKLTMNKIALEGTLKTSGQSDFIKQKHIRKPLTRSLLIAAIIASLCCLTAFAIKLSLSMRDAARIDMGISAETPIPEWTEYTEVEKEKETLKDVQVTLMSTMCAEERLYAYIAISPVPEQIAAILADNSSPEYEWDLSGMSTVSCSFHTEQTSYDPETQTALVKVFVFGEELRELEQVELTLELTHNLKPEERYGPIVIPVTESQMISIPVDIPIENTKAHIEDWWGLRPEMPDVHDYVSEGRITQIAICAGYIEVELETPSLSQWTIESNAEQVAEQVEIHVDPEMPLPPGMEDIKGWLIRSMFGTSWSFAVNEALQGATVNYKDGTSDVIDEIPRVFAGIWIGANSITPDSVYEGKRRYQFTPKQAFDLSAVDSLTIDGTKYYFHNYGEIDS